jgi:hypothetical protein
MGSQLINSLVTVAVAIIGVAIVAVLVSKNANTQGVIQSASAGFGQALSVAEAPVTGSSGTGGIGSLSGWNSGGGTISMV